MRIATGYGALAIASLQAMVPAPAQASGDHDVVEAARLRSQVAALADDAMEGRGAGYPGEQRAAEYIANAFLELGLQPFGDHSSHDNGDGNRSYFQAFDFHPRDPERAWQRLSTRNVIAVLPGGDLAHEVVVLGAHHDGQGMAGQANAGRFGGSEAGDTIWNSASDNATSVAALLEIARVLAAEKVRLRRSTVFATFSAEEYSLNGAVEYVARPPVAWERHVAMINLEKLVGDPDAEFITATSGSSPVFDDIADIAAATSGTPIRPFYPGLVTDTDHYPFVARQLPAIVIGTGSYVHIHEPGDEAGRLDYPLLAARVDFILHFLTEIANRDGDFAFTGDTEGYLGVLGSPPTAAELRERGVDTGTFALKVSAVIPGMAGHRAGIVPGDLVVAVDGAPLRPIDDGYFTLFDAIDEAGAATIGVTVVRPDSQVVLRLSR